MAENRVGLLRISLSGLACLLCCTAAWVQTAAQMHVTPSALSAERAAGQTIRLVVDDSIRPQLEGKLPPEYDIISLSTLDGTKLVSELADGDSLVWIGNGTKIPRDLWVGEFTPAKVPLKIGAAAHSPLKLAGITFRDAEVSSAYILPTKLLPYHGVDEEPRAEFLPILEARDRFGRIIGYPAVLMHHFAASTVRHRFSGSECFFFLFDNPSKAMDAGDWRELLGTIASRFRAHLQLDSVVTDYSAYRLGERVEIRAELRNLRPHAAAATVKVSVKAPGENTYRSITSTRRVPDGMSTSEAIFDFVPHGRAGLWTIRVEAWQDPKLAQHLALEGNPVFVDRRDIGIVVLNGTLQTPPIISTDGPNLRVDGKDAFVVGTNYYPSTSWWDWEWRDFHPLKVAADFAAMRRTGYRVVRMWVDPFLDEESLRSLQAAVYLAAQHGITLDLTIFTQWTRTIGFERPNGDHVRFDFRSRSGFNMYGISLQNIELQKEYVSTIASRLRNAGNVIYDISNEIYIHDPDPTQMDPEVQSWSGIPKQNGIVRDSLLFQRWTDEMTSAIRSSGGNQLVIPGKMFSDQGGGDQFVADRHGAIESMHDYNAPEKTGLDLAYVDPGCTDRPYILEEFGIGDKWNDPQRYDGDAHYALGAGTAAAMSYEWGISWLERELSFFATPIRESRDFKPDPRWFPYKGLTDPNVWILPKNAVGLFSAPSGFNWGSIYHGTPFPAEAAIALGRMGLIGAHLARQIRPEKVYVIVPAYFHGARSGTAEVMTAIKTLWDDHVPFGVVQEECLPRLPDSARVVIAPKGVANASEPILQRIRRSGVQVFVGLNNGWEQAAQRERIIITASEHINLLVRGTTAGTLYVLANNGPARSVTLNTEQNRAVTLGLADYAMVQESPAGVDLIEASRQASVGGANLFSIDRGRVTVASDDGQDLLRSKEVTVIATQPSRIQFRRAIESVDVLEPGRAAPVGHIDVETPNSIKVDSELIRYVLRVHFR